MHLTAGIWNERSNRLCAMARLSRTRRRCWALQAELLSVHTEPNCSHLKERHPPEGFTVLPGSSEPEVSRETKAADWMSAGSCQKLKAPCSAMQFTPIVATVLSGNCCWLLHRPPPCVRNEILAVNFSIPTLAISEMGERPLHSWAFLFQRKNQTTSLDLWSLRCRTFCLSSFNFAPPSPDTTTYCYRQKRNHKGRRTLTNSPALSGPLLPSSAPTTAKNVACSTAGGAGNCAQSARSGSARLRATWDTSCRPVRKATSAATPGAGRWG